MRLTVSSAARNRAAASPQTTEPRTLRAVPATASAPYAVPDRGIWSAGIHLFLRFGFGIKTAMLVTSLAVPLILLLAWQLQARYQDANKARMSAVQQQAEVAHGILAWAHSQEQSGSMTREQAQAMARQTLSSLRYGANEYFWINDFQARMVMHPLQPELDGRDVSQMRDPNGFTLFQTAASIGAQGGGFMHYQWPRTPGAVPADKASYIKGFAPWNWVVGTGAYIDDIRAAAWEQIRFNLIAIAILSLLAVYFLTCFYLSIRDGLADTRHHLRAMKDGDLTTTPVIRGADEVTALARDLRDMQASLRAMVQHVRDSSDDIVHSSSEIASGAMDLSSRTEQTAANLEETAAAMEEINATVKNATDNTAECAREAQRSADAAVNGGKVMREVVNTMENIQTSSSRIAEIVSTIDSIAFQTNILALNAAVEAARTGELGRGFAVVAGEVRLLAHRSATAASEIKTLIDESVGQVQAGTAIVRDASNTIEEIVASSQRVNQLLNEVAVGAQEQNLGISQIGQAVQELDRMTQENAAMVEQSVAAAAGLKQDALELSQEVGRFRVPAQAGTASAALVASSAPAGQMDLNDAIQAHRQWRVTLRKAIASQDRLDADTISRDDCCKLGKWLHGPGGHRWSTDVRFTELLQGHADFHHEAGNVARTINAGQYQDAERLIGSGSEFAKISTHVVTLLNAAKGWMRHQG